MDEPGPEVNVELQPQGLRFRASRSLPLLIAARQQGLKLPSSCRNGTCRTCMCRLVSGAVSYRIDWPGLSAEEKAEGYVLPCVAYPDGDVTLQLQQNALPIRAAESGPQG